MKAWGLPYGGLGDLGAWGAGESFRSGARIGLRLAPCALRGSFRSSGNTNARTPTRARTRNRQLVLGDRESAIGEPPAWRSLASWILCLERELPLQCKRKRGFLQFGEPPTSSSTDAGADGPACAPCNRCPRRRARAWAFPGRPGRRCPDGPRGNRPRSVPGTWPR